MKHDVTGEFSEQGRTGAESLLVALPFASCALCAALRAAPLRYAALQRSCAFVLTLLCGS